MHAQTCIVINSCVSATRTINDMAIVILGHNYVQNALWRFLPAVLEGKKKVDHFLSGGQRSVMYVLCVLKHKHDTNT